MTQVRLKDHKNGDFSSHYVSYLHHLPGDRIQFLSKEFINANRIVIFLSPLLVQFWSGNGVDELATGPEMEDKNSLYTFYLIFFIFD